MNPVRYVISTIKENSDKLCVERHKNKFLIRADMLYCVLVRRVHAFEYYALGFDSIPRSLRDTYVTTHRVAKVNRLLNHSGSANLLTNKYYAGTVLAEFYKRPCIQNIGLSYEKFLQFLEGRERFIYKPINGYGGEGHVVYKTAEHTPEEMYAEIMAAPRGVLEGWIEQHEVLNRLYPGAVHTVRLHTVHDGSGKNIEVFGANLSVAYSGELANTHYLSTLNMQVDIETGIIVTNGLQRDTNTLYEEIPSTHVKARGYQLPDWTEALELCRRAAAAVPEIGFIGWDIAFTPDGPVICEGNVFPGVVNWQNYTWYKQGHACGGWPILKKYIDKKRKKGQ